MRFRSAILATLSAVLIFAGVARAEKPLDYDRDVRPILADRCFKCHDQEKQKGGLRLDLKPSMMRGGDSGEPAVVPGSLDKSHLLKVITSADPEQMMPPKGDRLTTEQVAVLQKWIETGAHWIDVEKPAAPLAVEPGMQVTEKDRQFWSFVAPKKSEPPTTKNADWPRTRIDHFILGKLESAGLSPSAEASRQVLVRRLSYDLTGLPPTPEQVEAFVSDERADACERLVDRLLASPQFGERMASLWLPLARYAEDQAHQVGNDTKAFYPHAWKYRKWVVDAFNRDLPYDQFVKFQIAADKEKDAKPDDLAALGFLGLGPKYYNRGRLEVMAEEWSDQLDTVSRTTLGLTVACARCHDHKFDPIPTSDYYALAGVFASMKLVNKTPAGVVQKGELPAEKVDPAMLHVVEDTATPQDLNLFIRGSVDRKGPVIPRHFLTVLSSGEPTPFKEGSGRGELADAIADPHNPLTARVMVNRIWGMLFGNPLVATPSNFGRSGAMPTDQALLDDLAVRFTENGWSVKTLIREMVLSATYRQSCDFDPAKAAKDSSNALLWHMNRRRLTVEQWRDTLLDVCGDLDPAGGASLELDDAKNHCRTVYARISRLKLNDVLMQFDYPDANVHAERRAVTNTPMQKLFMLNSPFMQERAKKLVARLEADAASDDPARIRRAYQLLYARDPEPQELDLALKFLGKLDEGKMSRWERYAQVLLDSNELLYVD